MIDPLKTILVAKDPRMIVFSRAAHARAHNTIDMEHIEKYCTIMTSNWYQLNQLNDNFTNAPYIMLTKDELFQNQKRKACLDANSQFYNLNNYTLLKAMKWKSYSNSPNSMITMSYPQVQYRSILSTQ